MLEIGTIIDGKYQILDVLGRGGTSCVYLAENTRIQKKWAIKEVFKNSAVGVNGGESGKLIAESKLLTRLRHSGLPDIVDVIETKTSYLVIMEFIEGVTLEKIVQEQGAQSEETVGDWGKQLCGVLDYLHSQQPPIIYRDMKPANIMLKPNGDIVLIDFGIAREFNYDNHHDTTHLGTHGYAAPEQYNDDSQSDARTDVYGLGMTLYRLLTGQDPCVPPYGIQPIKKYNKHTSKYIEKVIQKCTELEQKDRYQTVYDLKMALTKRTALGLGGKLAMCSTVVILLVASLIVPYVQKGKKPISQKDDTTSQEEKESTNESDTEIVENGNDNAKEEVRNVEQENGQSSIEGVFKDKVENTSDTVLGSNTKTEDKTTANADVNQAPSNAEKPESNSSGNASNPYLATPDLNTMSITTVNIPAGKTLYYGIQRVGGKILTINDANAYVIESDGTRHNASGGKVSFTVKDALASDYVMFQIGNNSGSAKSFTIKFSNSTGSYQNPTIAKMNNNITVSLSEGDSDGHWYQYVAEITGKIRFYLLISPDSNVLHVTNNRNSASRTTVEDAQVDSQGTYVELEVQQGDVIIINVVAKTNNRGKYPATTVVWRLQSIEGSWGPYF